MTALLVKALLSAAVVVAVAEVSDRFPRLGALLLTLPLVSILAFVATWTKSGEMGTIARLSRETLVLVPLGLPFFVPFALADRTRLSFWPSFGLGLLLASLTVGAWFRFAPNDAPAQHAPSDRDGDADASHP
jgi:hypothetical protein